MAEKMNNQQKIKLFWEITNNINKKFCNSKLIINKIIFFKNKTINGQTIGGYYNSSKKEIGICSKEPLLLQLITLHHEFAHSFQHQIEKLPDKKIAVHKKGCFFKYQRFLKESDKLVEIGLNPRYKTAIS